MASRCTLHWKKPDWTEEQRKAELTRRINQWGSRVLTNIYSDPERLAKWEQYQIDHPEHFVKTRAALQTEA